MTSLRGAPLLARLKADFEHLPFPAFMIGVEDDGFRFLAINPPFEAATGKSASQLEGHRPEDCLHPDIVAQILPFYRTCRDKARPVSFSITLDTAPQAYAWRAALTPLLGRDSAVIALHGQAVDISEDYQALGHAARIIAGEARAREQLQILMSDTMADLSRALREARALTSDLHGELAGNEDADATLDRLRRLVGAADGAVRQADVLNAGTLGHGLHSAVPLDLLCADLCQSLDPEDRLRISYGEERITANPALVHVCLRALLVDAVQTARRWVEIEAMPVSEGLVRLRLRDDRAAPGRDRDPALVQLSSVLARHGGGVETAHDTRWHISDAIFPGTMAGHAHVPALQQIAL
ncbi:MAG: hypothetical protein CSA65_05110 [Proteobacteria bacterium]|nr:MAG: hypothetical protein CSA65_05110 [Pseudomonadota bacterium]